MRQAVLAALVTLLALPAASHAGAPGCPGGCLRGRPAAAGDVAPKEPAEAQAALPSAGHSPGFLEPRQLAEEPRHLVANAQVWRSSGAEIAAGRWCRALQPAQDWRLGYCGDGSLEVKIMTQNLYWWNLFGAEFQNGNGGSVGRLIRDSNAGKPFDFMAFQECEDARRVLRDGGLTDTFEVVSLGYTMAIAYRKTAWRLLDHDLVGVAEDQPGLYGRRALLRARFQHHATGKTVLVANHHGPLMVNTGGVCGGTATAWNILRAIGERAQERDAVILMGDFNSEAGSETVRELDKWIHRHYTGSSFNGVDHLYSSCEPSRVRERKNLGSAGSDHDALMEILTI